jgi:hypothetical protein
MAERAYLVSEHKELASPVCAVDRHQAASFAVSVSPVFAESGGGYEYDFMLSFIFPIT